MRGAKLVATVALALALYAAATVGTASGALAQEAAQAWNCDPNAAVAVGRGGLVREPDLNQVHADLLASAKGKAGARFKATVPVYFHVVTDGSIGNLTATQIADQISVLNLTFGGGEGGARTGFTFELAGVTRTDNAK